MRIFSTAAGAVRHGLGAVVEAGLVVAIAGVLVFGAAVVGRTDPAGAADAYAAKPGGDAIWIAGFEPSRTASSVPVLPYGSDFGAGYSTRAAEPWGFAQCWANDSTVLGTPNQGTYSPGDVIWSEYRSLYPGGPVPANFQLNDPIQHLWLGGGADCTLSLLKFSGGYSRMTVLATTPFVVEP
jgi:hypothetical protein